MELREIKPQMLLWYPVALDSVILCRVRFIGKDYVALTVVAATAEQVIASNLGVGEVFNSLPVSLRRV